ncbi:MAG: hypothetical protein KDK30_04175, partial [Leptospiraceae bacterium]|nr:hypothetical protein [Leptospiraceae bacterium]
MSILNQYFRRIAHLPPALLIVLIGLLYAFLIFGRSEKPFYSDPGLMYLQTVDVLQRGDFVFDYQGRDIDPEYRLLPFRRPFLEKVNNEYYIDFPPYWPLINAPLLWLMDTAGLFIWNLTAFVLTLIVIAGITRIFLNTNAAMNLAILLYSFGCAAPLYTLYFHEYTVALLPATLSFYLILRYVHSGERRRDAVLAGFCAAISLYFRLEFVFFYIAIGLYPLLRNRRLELRGGLLMLAGFALPFCVLLYCNQQIHGHPLGLRYTLTMNAVMGSPAGHPADTEQQADTESNGSTGPELQRSDPTTPQSDESRPAPDTTPGDHLLDPLPDGGNDRLAIIQSLLFSRLRGLFYQSPFLLLGMFLWAYARWKRSARDLFPSAMVLLISGTLILLFAPNTGDHFAPRYLFVLIPPAIVLGV